MREKQPIRIANISSVADPGWLWIEAATRADYSINGRQLEWRGFSMATSRALSSRFERRIATRFQSLARFRGAQALKDEAKAVPFDLIISHGPWATAWTETVLGHAKGTARHLAFSFNFTELPTGVRKRLMQRAFKTVDAFAVFTSAEQRLYQDWFNIKREKILRAPWGVAPPLSKPPPRMIQEPYFASLGGEARDYETLCETARRCPETRFVVIARPHNFDGVSPPDNLTVSFNLPKNYAWGVVWHADAAIIPLRGRDTPCGLVATVGGMHLGKAQIVTEAVGVSDYLTHGECGLMVPARDPDALAHAVRQLAGDPALRFRLGAAAKAFAGRHCSETATVRFFEDLLKRWFD